MVVFLAAGGVEKLAFCRRRVPGRMGPAVAGGDSEPLGEDVVNLDVELVAGV